MKQVAIIVLKGWLIAVPLFFYMVATGQSIRYSNFYDSNMGAEILAEGVKLDDNSLVIAGVTSNSNGSGYGKVFNLMVDVNGLLQYSYVWEEDQKTIGVYAIVRTESGGIFEAGTIHDYSVSSLGTGDFFLAKLDETGDTLFAKVFERPDTSDFMLDIVQTRPNKLLLIGWTYNDVSTDNADLFFITTDTLGNELNRVVWGGGNTDYIHSGLVANNEGEVLMTGFTRNFGGGQNGRSWVVKTDSIGNVLWHQEFSDEFGAVGSSGQRICQLADGNFLVAGGNLTYGNSSHGVDAGLLKIDPDGNQIWAKEYPVSEGQGLWDVKELEDGSIVSCGVTQGNDDSQAGWLIKTNADGDMQWSRTFNPSGFVDFIRFMLVMPNEDIVMLGNGRAPGETIQDGWVLRVDREGCLVEGCSVGVEELPDPAQGTFKAYPNPFSQEVTIAYNLKDDCKDGCFIRLTDIQGRMVYELPVHASNGPSSITFDLGRYESGMYICSLYNNQRLLQTSRLIRME